MGNRKYTVLIVPERSSTVRRYTIPHRVVVRTVLAASGVAALAAFALVHYLYMFDQAGENRQLKNENISLQTRLRLVQEEIARIDGTLQRINQFATKVRAITQLSDPERNIAIGPLEDPNAGRSEVLYAPGERIDSQFEQMDSKLAMRLTESKVEELQSEALREESNQRELREYFAEGHEVMLATTPSIRPIASKLVTSTFGVRKDPYTNHRVMHKGIDFAADHGSDVVAPADGRIIFVGHRGSGYGKTVVVDHGYGLQTHYAHLSSAEVEVGQDVTRGQLLAKVGNTGRTTGPHLHYEVRLNGIPQDPNKYILE